MTLNKLAILSGLALGMVGCGGATAESGGGARTAHAENAPAPPSDEDIQKHQQQQKEAAKQVNTAEQMLAAKKAAAEERADFDAAFAKWEAAKKANTVMQDCKSLASNFESVARSHKSMAAQALFNAGT